MATNLTIVLASRSPRRVELLHRLVSDFIVMPADLDETPHPHEDPVAYVRRLALQKARAVYLASEATSVVVGADTTVDLNGDILGQPIDDDDARRMLQLLRYHSSGAHRRGSSEQSWGTGQRRQFRRDLHAHLTSDAGLVHRHG